MEDAPPDKDHLLVSFCKITGGSIKEAEELLAVNEWDLTAALDDFYTPAEHRETYRKEREAIEGRERGEPDEGDSSPEATGRRPSPSSIKEAKPGQAPASNKLFSTIQDLMQVEARGRHKRDDDDDYVDDDEDEESQDVFAGGEKSGLAVQHPSDARRSVKDILRKARNNVSRPEGDSPAEPVSQFRGTGQTLGGDDAPSQVVPDPNADLPRRLPKVTRILHFWQNGFSVEDGPLFRFDDPTSSSILALIRSGKAPLAIMGVEAEQRVDVTVQQHEEDYIPPKKKYKPFGNGGQRLGSPTPGPSSGSGGQAASTSRPSSESTAPARVEIDESQPAVSLQIRLADGSRLVSRFNTSQPLNAVYDFVAASMPASEQRPWILMTTFPSRELRDRLKLIEELPEFKRGGVLVQKWY